MLAILQLGIYTQWHLSILWQRSDYWCWYEPMCFAFHTHTLWMDSAVMRLCQWRRGGGRPAGGGLLLLTMYPLTQSWFQNIWDSLGCLRSHAPPARACIALDCHWQKTVRKFTWCSFNKKKIVKEKFFRLTKLKFAHGATCQFVDRSFPNSGEVCRWGGGRGKRGKSIVASFYTRQKIWPNLMSIHLCSPHGGLFVSKSLYLSKMLENVVVAFWRMKLQYQVAFINGARLCAA